MYFTNQTQWGLAVTLFLFLVSCTPTKTTSTSPTDDGVSYDKENIIALLQPGKNAKALAKEFTEYGLTPKRQTSRSENRYMFSYNVESIDADILLEKIKASPLVIEAAFPKLVKKPRVSDGY